MGWSGLMMHRAWSDPDRLLDSLARAAARRRSRRISMVTAVVSCLAAVVGVTGMAWAYEDTRADRLLPGVSVMGVDVSSVNREAAMALVRSRIDDLGTEVVVFKAGGEDVPVALADLGVTGPVAEAVEEAFRRTASVGAVRRIWRRSMHVSSDIAVDLRLVPDGDVIKALTDRVAARVDKAPGSTRLAVVEGAVRLVPGEHGRRLDRDAAQRVVAAAVDRRLQGRGAQAAVELPIVTVPSVPNPGDIPAVLVVRVDEQELHYYAHGQQVATYGVATGLSGYDTPLGDFQVTEKLAYPAWENPAPTTWGRNMPLYIPPGPNNPLGTHAIGINSPGIYLHETSGGVGAPASHGCVRMRPADLQELFEIVPVGSPVLVMYGPETYVPDLDWGALREGLAAPSDGAASAQV